MFGIFRKSARHRQESAIGAAMAGGLMMVVAFPMLFLNEGRAVKTARSLAEGASSVVSVSANQREDTNDGKLIHFAGQASPKGTLADESFGIKVDAIRLTRTVEMYQWREIKSEVTREVDGKRTKETEYEYDKTWSEELISSAKFHDSEGHINPTEMLYPSKSVEAKTVMVGDYQLSHDLIRQIDAAEPMPVDLALVPKPLADNLRADGGIESSAVGFYWSVKPNVEQAEVGDLRIRFAFTPPTDVSVIAQQSGEELKAYSTRSGRKLSMLSVGNESAEEMFDQAEAENTALTWMLRGFGSVLMVLGSGLILKPLALMTDWIPVLGKLVGLGTALVAIFVGTAFSLLSISVAWLFYRPLIAVPLILLGIGLLVLLIRMAKSKRQPAEDTVDLVPNG